MIYFENELKLIKDEDVRNWTMEVLKHVNDKFYHEPASTTGKYHPSYALGEGGLYRHTVAAVKIANCIRENDSVFDTLNDENYDYIIAALILHDVCKCGKEWQYKHTRHAHPLYASELIEEVLGSNSDDAKKNYYVITVKSLVASHMGQWNRCTWDKAVLPIPTSDEAKVVHLCDYLASRKFLEVNFEV